MDGRRETDAVTPQAREALDMAASETDQVASALETMADLYRQAAEHLRRGGLAERGRLVGDARRLTESLSPRLALITQLVQSVETRDPALWRRHEMASVAEALRGAPLPVVRALAELHRATCSHGSDCPILRVAAERLR